jgi:peptidoglycan hydrolase CwlO-like protein
MADYDGDLKLLHHKIDAQTKKIDKIDEKLDPVCDMVARHDERIKTAENEVKILRKRSNVWDGVNSLGILITGFLTTLKGS